MGGESSSDIRQSLRLPLTRTMPLLPLKPRAIEVMQTLASAQGSRIRLTMFSHVVHACGRLAELAHDNNSQTAWLFVSARTVVASSAKPIGSLFSHFDCALAYLQTQGSTTFQVVGAMQRR